MKCLEMIKHNLDLCEKGDTDYGFVYKSELEEIKFCLEVLEILKEQYNGECSEEEMFGVGCVEDKNRKWICLTVSTDNEKYNKLKQWLEENESERKTKENN
jgi:hypothetical protein